MWWSRGNPSLLVLLGSNFHHSRHTWSDDIPWVVLADGAFGMVRTNPGFQRHGGHWPGLLCCRLCCGTKALGPLHGAYPALAVAMVASASQAAVWAPALANLAFTDTSPANGQCSLPFSFSSSTLHEAQCTAHFPRLYCLTVVYITVKLYLTFRVLLTISISNDHQSIGLGLSIFNHPRKDNFFLATGHNLWK